MRHQAARLLLALAAAAVHAGQALANPDDGKQSLARSQASLAWLANAECPSLGFPPAAKGLETPEAAAAVRDSNWEFAQGRLEAVRKALATRAQAQQALDRLKSKPSERTLQELAAIDAEIDVTVAKVATALVQHTLANWVHMAMLDPSYPYPPAAPHPLLPYLERERRLSSLIRDFGVVPTGAQSLQPIGAKVRHCLLITQNQIVQRNADSVYAALEKAGTSSAAEAIKQPYAVVDASFTATNVPLPEVIQAHGVRVAALRDEERRRAEEEEARLRAEAAAKRGKEGGNRAAPAPMPTGSQADLQVATAVVRALVGRSVQTALQHMHNDVVLVSPAGTQYGKQQVGSTLQQGFASGRGGSLGEPYFGPGGQVVADVSSQRGAARMIFEISGGLVSRIRIAR